MQEAFMRRAIEIARTALDIPGTLPFGAVVVKDGRIVGEGLNRSFADQDPLSHGETEAIRDACRKLGTTSLAGCELYTTCEPCAMCVAAMYLCGIEHLYYAGTAEESGTLFATLAQKDPKWGRRWTGAQLRAETGKPIDGRSLPATRLMAAENLALFESFRDRNL
jgi:guanine deaminase